MGSPRTQTATWGEGVKRLRQEQGLSQTELAAKVGCSQAAISRLELDQVRLLPDRTKVRIARALGVNVLELFPYEVEDDDVA